MGPSRGLRDGDRTKAGPGPSDESVATREVGSSGEHIAELARRIAALEDEVRAFRAEEAARAMRLQSASDGSPGRLGERGAKDADAARGAKGDVASADDPAAAEKVRDRWKGLLAESEKRLWAVYPSGPDPRGDVVAWTRFEDLKRAREALDGARDMAALRALAEGEFKHYFKLER